MGPGLVRMLDLIQASPSDSMLVDRFLVLAADIPEHERVDATLKLASTLLIHSPRRSIEISWMVFQAGKNEMLCLSLISDALEKIGKPNKALILRGEMARLQNEKLSDDAKMKVRQTIVEHVTTALTEFDAAPNSPMNLELEDSEKKVVHPDMTLLVSSVIHHEPNGLDLKNPGQAESKKSMAQKESAAPMFNMSLERQDIHPPKRPSIARVSAATPGAGIPEAIPPREPSRQMHKLIDVHQTEASKIKKNLSLEAKPPIFKAMSPEERRQRLDDLAKAEEYDAFLELLEHSFSSIQDSSLMKIFETYRLAQIDIRFARWWLDILMANFQERRALRYALNLLESQPQLAWARMIWPKVCIMRDRLYLSEIHWAENEGVLILCERMKQLSPRSRCYLLGCA